MLRKRIATSLLLLAVLLPVLFYETHEPFALLTLLLIGTAAWEWARLNGCTPLGSWGWGVALVLVLALMWYLVGWDQPMHWLWKVSAGVWVVLTVLLLRRGVLRWANVPRWCRLWVGWALLGVAWWALVHARLVGVDALLSILALVWIADIGAYFGGKAIGKRKLAPSISPGKTWAGVVSGWLAVCLLAWAWLHWGPADAVHLFTELRDWGVLPAALALSLLVLMSVAGDLVESVAKRSAGRKDSSSLLPGHGGVLDRIDSLLPVLPMAMMMIAW